MISQHGDKEPEFLKKKKKKKKKNPHVGKFVRRKLIGTGDWGLSGVIVNMEQGM